MDEFSNAAKQSLSSISESKKKVIVASKKVDDSKDIEEVQSTLKALKTEIEKALAIKSEIEQLKAKFRQKNVSIS